MRLLADMHISPRTVAFLRALGHDVVRVSDILPLQAPDEAIVSHADENGRVVLTQDLDFSAIIALSGQQSPSLVSLRLASARVEYVNTVLAKVLPEVEEQLLAGAIVTVEDQRVRVRQLPVTVSV
jgi:predicted nuclease of predicted toxin-antitoxin system